MAIFDEIGKKITKTGQAAVQKTKDMTETLRLNNLISDEDKKIESCFHQIGKTYYKLYANDCGAEFAEQVARIKESRARISAYTDQINQMKGIMNCPNCGKEVPVDNSFCNACGSVIDKKPPAPKFTEEEKAEPVTAEVVCTVCGEKLTADSIFCTNCGQKT